MTTEAHKPWRVLALDVGKKRVGLALSDPSRTIAQPLYTLEIKSSLDVCAREIIQLAEEHQVRKFVVGDPLELDGSRGKQAAFTKKFVDILLRNAVQTYGETKKISETEFQAGDIAVIMFDERFTSCAASQVLTGSDLKNKEWREAKDAVSASLILEGYLERQRSRN